MGVMCVAHCLTQSKISLSDNMLIIFNQKKWTDIQKLKKEEDTGRDCQEETFHLGLLEKKNQKGVWPRKAIWLRAENFVGLSGGARMAVQPQGAE